MTFVHTAHGVGQIVATETMRGRTRHKVAGAGFEVWLDATEVHTASLGDINEDNSTTLPYDPTPQYPSDMWSHDTTIQPGDQEIDAEDRLSPSDSLNFDSRSNRAYPGPDPSLFAKGAGLQVGPWSNDDWEQIENHDPTDEYRNHPDGWSHQPTEQDYADWEAKHRRNAAKIDSEGNEYPRELGDDQWYDDDDADHGYDGDTGTTHKKSNLGPKYASWLLEAQDNGDDTVSRFRRDPIQEINRMGYLWTGGVEEPETREYGRLVEADKQLREAAWNDVRQKAQRLRREGRVHVLHKQSGNIYANVDGDHGNYSVMISKVGVRNQSIDKWACSCDWGKWAFLRKISYVGRLCSHGYATYLELMSDQHKGNPGRFVHPYADPATMMSPLKRRKTSSLTDDFQDYVDDYRDGHVDLDAADNFISLPEHGEPLSHDEVSDIYDWARDNASERQPRDYKQHYTAAEDGVKVLRTQPHGLTPDLVKVPGPEDSYFVDVEEDERETTGPGQTVLSMVDALGNRYTPASFWRTADETELVPEDTDLPAAAEPAAEVSDPGVATPRIPDSTGPARKEETGANGGTDGTSGFNMSDFTSIAEPVIEGVSQFAGPVAEGIGSAIGGIFSSRTADYDYDGPTNTGVPEGDIEHLRELSDEEADYGHRDSQNQELADLVDSLHEDGFAASPIVAALDYRDDESGPSYRDHSISRHRGNGMYSTFLDGKGMHSADTLQGIKETIDDHLDGTRREGSYGAGNQDAAPPGGAYWQPGGGSWADGPANGSGPDPKFWRGTSEDLIERGDNDIEEVDVTEGEGETHYLDKGDYPSQGKSARRRRARSEPDVFPEDTSEKAKDFRTEYEPDMTREGSGGWQRMLDERKAQQRRDRNQEEFHYQMPGTMSMPKYNEDGTTKSARRRYADEEKVRNNLIQSLGEEIEGIGLYNDFLDDAEDAGDDFAAAAIEHTIEDEHEHVDHFSDALEGAGRRAEAGKHDTPAQGMFDKARSADDWDENGSPHSHSIPELDHDWQWTSEPPMMKKKPGPNPKGVGRHRAEASNDIVRQFQASGGGALAGSGGGNFGDDAIAGQARKFLAKTAGRVYSLAEQQELVDESHPNGARNKPNDDDLAGTHYV